MVSIERSDIVDNEDSVGSTEQLQLLNTVTVTFSIVCVSKL
jgi:hypothetical protein